MGKSKQRSLRLGINDRVQNLSRDDAIKTVISMIKSENNEVVEIITLFGLTAEELLESGASYESILKFKGILK